MTWCHGPGEWLCPHPHTCHAHLSVIRDNQPTVFKTSAFNFSSPVRLMIYVNIRPPLHLVILLFMLTYPVLLVFLVASWIHHTFHSHFFSLTWTLVISGNANRWFIITGSPFLTCLPSCHWIPLYWTIQVGFWTHSHLSGHSHAQYCFFLGTLHLLAKDPCSSSMPHTIPDPRSSSTRHPQFLCVLFSLVFSK